MINLWRRRRVISSSAVIVLALLGVGCGPDTSRDEVSRMPSPDGTLDAVLTETNGGATTSFGYDVTISARGQKDGELVAHLYGATRNADAYGVNLKWADAHTLRIEYFEARKVLDVINNLSVNGQRVKVELVSGVEDPRAPAGGMWDNINHQAK